MRRAAAIFVLALLGVATLWILWPEGAAEALLAQEAPAPIPAAANHDGDNDDSDASGADAEADEAEVAGNDTNDGVLPPAGDLAPTPGTGRAPLPKRADGKIDFEAMGLTGKEVGAGVLRREETRHETVLNYRWDEGDEWTVETYYRQMQSGYGEVWSAPTYWRFKVDRNEVCQGVSCQVLVVTMLGANGAPVQDFPPCTYYISVDDHQLVAADVYHVSGGKGKFSRVGGGTGALGIVGSIVPFDLPVRGTRGTVVSAPPLEAPRTPMTARSRRSLPQAGELLGAGDDYVEVAYASPGDGTKITQRWAASDLRWPASSITHHRRSYRRR